MEFLSFFFSDDHPLSLCRLSSTKCQEKLSPTTVPTMASNTGDTWLRSASTIVAVRSYHELKIQGYSKTFNTHTSDCPSFKSRPFGAGRRTWQISYLPTKGSLHRPGATGGYISFSLILADNMDEAVTAQATFSLLDQDHKPVDDYTKTTGIRNFSSTDRICGYEKLIEREELEKSSYLKDDCFTVRVNVHIVKQATSVMVPPSDIHQHLGDLLLNKMGTDVEFRVEGKIFAAHRLVLGARSSVFRAELYGPMKEGTVKNIVQVDDMEAQVFSALLTFVYTDAWPEMEQEDESAMAQHLLVAADRYNLQKLKLMCEDKLRSHIHASSVVTILVLAEKHDCLNLKRACFNFFSSSSDQSLADIETDDFDYLAATCPNVTNELKFHHRS